MEVVAFKDVEVDRCTLCKGLWFDSFEADQLKDMKGSEEIDIGDPEVGRVFNRDDRIDCPRCKTGMIRMVDPKQTHIWMESCTVCHGVFFDAGEFRDFKRYTVVDFFRGLRAGERP
jgi:Zn-finger nucleic acid-binding protein